MVFGLLFYDTNLSKYMIIFKISLDKCDICGLFTRNYAKQIVNNLPVHIRLGTKFTGLLLMSDSSVVPAGC